MQINTKTIGDRSAIAVISALIFAGKHVSIPFGDNLRYDVVFEEHNKFNRVQIKTGRYNKKRGSVYFEPNSRKHSKGKYIRKGYLGEVDFFGVYVEDINKVYLIPIKDTVMSGTTLRLNKPKNNQFKGIKYIHKYELKPIKL